MKRAAKKPKASKIAERVATLENDIKLVGEYIKDRPTLNDLRETVPFLTKRVDALETARDAKFETPIQETFRPPPRKLFEDYSKLCREGFTPAQAVELVKVIIEQTLTRPFE